MSQRICNYCEYERLKRFAKATNSGIVVKPAPKDSFPNGIDVFFRDDERGEGEIWMLWFAELSEQCAC